MTPTPADTWLGQHAYLQPLADLHEAIDAAAAGASIPASPVPQWEEYRADYLEGVPVLRSPAVAIDWTPAADAFATVVERMAGMALPPPTTSRLRVLRDELHTDPEAAYRAVNGLSHPGTFLTDEPGLWQLIGWEIVARMFRDLVPAFGQWRDEERWLRPYCPTCGAAPAMAQLVGSDPGRLRLLSCGCCRTRWRFRRTGCPFCRNEDDHRLSGFAVEGDDRLRIDYCEACGGYLKTYVGEGGEALLLADWTSLHLDVAARDRDLNRLAGSLYQI